MGKKSFPTSPCCTGQQQRKVTTYERWGEGEEMESKSILPKEEEWKVNFYFLSPPLLSLGLFWRRMGKKVFYGSVLVAWRGGSRGFFHKAKSGEQLRICCPPPPPPPSVRPPSEDRQPTLKRRGRRRNRVLLFLLYERALACSLLPLLSTSCFYPAWNKNHPFGKESHLDTVFVPVALQSNIRICSCTQREFPPWDPPHFKSFFQISRRFFFLKMSKRRRKYGLRFCTLFTGPS